MEDFYTRNNANNGKKLPLFLPDGSASDHWVRVLGTDSDAFRTVETASKRKAISVAAIENEDERAAAVRRLELECIAALVAEWSFDKPCVTDVVIDFLIQAPQIADQINRYAAKRANFLT